MGVSQADQTGLATRPGTGHFVDFMNSKPANSKPAAVKQTALSDESSPLQLVEWGLDYFSDVPVVLTSAFGMEGCALIDMCSKAIEAASLPPLTIACIDTDFFFKETQTLRDQLIAKYTNLNFVTWKTSVTPEQQEKQYGAELWKSNKDLCCNIRKVQPMVENIQPYKVWMTGCGERRRNIVLRRRLCRGIGDTRSPSSARW